MRRSKRASKKKLSLDYKGYRGQDLPLGSYTAIVGAYNLLFGALLGGMARKAIRFDVKDLVLLALSTHKLSRVITKDAVTAPFRAPLTRYQEDLGYGEVKEAPRGKGIKLAVGELLSCNYCADMWVGLAGLAALSYFPDTTRRAMSLFAAVTGADFLHVLYESSRTQSNVLTLEEEARAEKKAS